MPPTTCWADGAWRTVVAPALVTLEGLHAGWRAKPAAGDCRHGARSVRRAPGVRGSADRVRDARPVRAALLTCAQAAWAQGSATDAAQALPLYLRDRVALTSAEREAAKAGAPGDERGPENRSRGAARDRGAPPGDDDDGTTGRGDGDRAGRLRAAVDARQLRRLDRRRPPRAVPARRRGRPAGLLRCDAGGRRGASAQPDGGPGRAGPRPRRRMLDALVVACREGRATQLWLEVREEQRARPPPVSPLWLRRSGAAQGLLPGPARRRPRKTPS